MKYKTRKSSVFNLLQLIINENCRGIFALIDNKRL